MKKSITSEGHMLPDSRFLRPCTQLARAEIYQRPLVERWEDLLYISQNLDGPGPLPPSS